jgi:hypothetical protein
MVIQPPRVSSARWLAALLIGGALGGLAALGYLFDSKLDEKLIDLERAFSVQVNTGPAGQRLD